MNFIVDRIRGVAFGLVFAVIALISPKTAFAALLNVVDSAARVNNRVDELSK